MVNKVLGGGPIDGQLGVNPDWINIEADFNKQLWSIDEQGRLVGWIVETAQAPDGNLLANGLYANPAGVASDSDVDNEQIEANSKAIKSLLIAQGLSGNYGFFADGFTINDPLDVGIDASFQFWKYVGAETLPYDVPQGTDPSAGDWELISLSDHRNLINRNAANSHPASAISTGDGRSVEQRLNDLPAEVDAAGTAAALVDAHNHASSAHPELSAFITSEADRAEVAADVATSSGNIYADTTDGLVATSNGDYFSVVSPDDENYLDLYLNGAGTAVFQKSYPSSEIVIETNANAKYARYAVAGNVFNIEEIASGGRNVSTTIGYIYQQNGSGGSFTESIAATSNVDVPSGSGIFVDINGSKDGSGRLIPYVAIMGSSAQAGNWTEGGVFLLYGVAPLGLEVGSYKLLSGLESNIGIYDGEAAFPTAPNTALPTWNSETRTLWWPSTTIVVKSIQGNKRINLSTGSIVVPDNTYLVVCLDRQAVLSDASAPSTAVVYNRYFESGSFDGQYDRFIPLFAVNRDKSWPLRFPPVVGSSALPVPAAVKPYVSEFPNNELIVRGGASSLDVFIKGGNPDSAMYLRYSFTRNIDASIGEDTWALGEVWETERVDEYTFNDTLRINTGSVTEMAIQQTGKADFMGGGHGDELLTGYTMMIDGVVVDDMSSLGYFKCKRIEFFMQSELFEMDTNQTVKVADVYKAWKFEPNRHLEVRVTVDWIVSITLQDTYMAMLPVARRYYSVEDGQSYQITDKGFREPMFEVEDVETEGFSVISTNAGYAKLSGPLGYSAEVEVLEGWDKPNRRFNFSPALAYNKFYFDFTSSGYVTEVGERFYSKTRYRIDTSN